MATLAEIEGYQGQHPWSLKDLFDAHEALDIQEEAEEFYKQQAESKSGHDS